MESPETTTKTTSKTPKLKLDFKDSKYATGRRKKSIAKVWLKKGSGKIYVNGKNFQNYFSNDSHKMQIMRPFEIIEQSTEYDVKSNISGGGHTGQAGALVHGISKALLLFDSELKSALRKEKLTTRDSRAVERKKPGKKKARRSFQFSKR
jgi:small subunit ribosomal protein S9